MSNLLYKEMIANKGEAQSIRLVEKEHNAFKEAIVNAKNVSLTAN